MSDPQKQLTEYRVTLHKVTPEDPFRFEQKVEGRTRAGRTKLGGEPHWIQAIGSPNPKCPECSQRMTFVAQIDSLKDDWENSALTQYRGVDEPAWGFGDDGMLFVFFCFRCLLPHTEFESH